MRVEFVVGQKSEMPQGAENQTQIAQRTFSKSREVSESSVMMVDAIRLIDRRVVPLVGLKSLSVTAALTSPALSLSGVFAVSDFPGDLDSIVLYNGHTMLFSGKIDSQRSVLTSAGKLLHIDARSKGAMLLDNEAGPCVLTNVGLRTVFGLFCQPYGFVCYNPQSARSLAMYTVRAGQSEWEALTGYTRRVYGITPYVDGDQICICRPGSHQPVVISNTKKGLRFTRIEQLYTPYKIVSDVMMRDVNGSYSASVHNSSAAYYGVRRKRYVIPQNEFMDALTMDANQRIRRSMFEAQEVRVSLIGIVDLLLGQEVEIVDDAMTIHNLLVSERNWQLGQAGITTELVLVSSAHYA